MLIEAVKGDHPLWGYRRVWAYLRYRQRHVVGKNRIYRVMKENHLLVTKQMKLRAKRTPMRPKPRASRLNQYWGMDMTKILFPDGWSYLHIVKDWYNKEIVGWQLSKMSRAEDWLEALNNAVNKRFPLGAREESSLYVSANSLTNFQEIPWVFFHQYLDEAEAHCNKRGTAGAHP